MSNSIDLKRGIYHIIASEIGARPDAFTRIETDGKVIIFPLNAPGVLPITQEWQIEHANNNYTVTAPSQRWPALALTYDGPPESGAPIVTRRQDFPTKWHIEEAPDFHLYLEVPGTSLHIAVTDRFIIPPSLKLDTVDKLAVRFEFIRDLDD